MPGPAPVPGEAVLSQGDVEFIFDQGDKEKQTSINKAKGSHE